MKQKIVFLILSSVSVQCIADIVFVDRANKQFSIFYRNEAKQIEQKACKSIPNADEASARSCEGKIVKTFDETLFFSGLAILFGIKEKPDSLDEVTKQVEKAEHSLRNNEQIDSEESEKELERLQKLQKKLIELNRIWKALGDTDKAMRLDAKPDAIPTVTFSAINLVKESIFPSGKGLFLRAPWNGQTYWYSPTGRMWSNVFPAATLKDAIQQCLSRGMHLPWTNEFYELRDQLGEFESERLPNLEHTYWAKHKELDVVSTFIIRKPFGTSELEWAYRDNVLTDGNLSYRCVSGRGQTPTPLWP